MKMCINVYITRHTINVNMRKILICISGNAKEICDSCGSDKESVRQNKAYNKYDTHTREQIHA